MANPLAAVPKAALQAIALVGKPVTLKVTTGGTYDPGTQKVTGATTSNYAVKAVLEDYKAREIDGTRIRVGDRKYLIAASGLTVTPAPGNVLVDGSDSLSVVTVEVTYAGSVPALYTVQVRK